jgi:hypothetical protein
VPLVGLRGQPRILDHHTLADHEQPVSMFRCSGVGIARVPPERLAPAALQAVFAFASEVLLDEDYVARGMAAA